MTPELPKYAYGYAGIGVLTSVAQAEVGGVPNVKIIVPHPWRFRGMVESNKELTDIEVRERIEPPYEGFMVGDVRFVQITLIDGPPEPPTKPRPDDDK